MNINRTNIPFCNIFKTSYNLSFFSVAIIYRKINFICDRFLQLFVVLLWNFILPIMLIGYARVSTQLQDNATQIDALKKSGCETIFEETISGGRWERPKLQDLLKHIRRGDTVVVWKLDRLSRSLKDLLFIMEQIENKGAGFKSLTESIDTTTSAGKMMMQMVGVFAEFERNMLKERTMKGLEYAREQWRVGGRKPKLKPRQTEETIKLYKKGKAAAELAELFSVHKATVYRLLNRK